MHPTPPPPKSPGRSRAALLALLLGLLPAAAPAGLVAERPEVAAFVDEMVEKHGFDRPVLVALLDEARIRERVVTAAANPAEREPYHRYRTRFVNEERIAGGAAYRREHADLLARAEAEFGVPARIIVAILGVETRFGTYTGKHRVLDALATLAFEPGNRNDFYRRELEQFLLLSRDEAIDPLGAMGSYAGAMGHGQFIASSYRHYAVDFDGDGRRDLWSPADAIGSVANYFAAHRWQAGEPTVLAATVRGSGYRKLLERGIDPETPLRDFAGFGVTVAQPGDAARPAALLEFETEQGKSYWAGLNNFRVITRYNHSPRYAMAVHELAEAIDARR